MHIIYILGKIFNCKSPLCSSSQIQFVLELHAKTLRDTKCVTSNVVPIVIHWHMFFCTVVFPTRFLCH